MAIGYKKREREGEKTPTRVYSKRQETQIAKATGGSRQPNSGATPWAKGDVKTSQFLLEAKTKTKASESISIKKEWFEKNQAEAIFMGKPYTAIVFNFGPDEPNHYIIDEDLFVRLMEYLQEDGSK